MYRISLVAGLLLSTIQSASASGLAGDYAGQCTGSIQCAVEISERSVVTVIIADRFDYTKRKCTVSGVLKATATGLAGEIRRGWKVSVVPTPDGGIYLNGLPKQACGLDLNGYYAAIGD